MLAVIGRADCSGLATMTREFCREMRAGKALILSYATRGATDATGIENATVIEPNQLTLDFAMRWLEGVDTLVGFETLYSTFVVSAAMKSKTRLVMFPMWECSPQYVDMCDLLIALSDRDAEHYKQSVRVEWPVSRERYMKSDVSYPPISFVHNAGSLGYHGRNGTEDIIAASRYLDGTNAMLFVRSGETLPASWQDRASIGSCVFSSDWVPRERLYHNADVFVFPMRFPGLSLPLIEAAACRIPTIVADLPEWRSYPASMRVRVKGTVTHSIAGRRVEYASLDVDRLGEIMRALALGEQEALLPPEPQTWGNFREWWKGVS